MNVTNMTKGNKSSKKEKSFCEYCNKYILGNSYKFKAHLYLHGVIEPKYQCKHCLKQFYRYDMYYRHLSTHENSEVSFNKCVKTVFTCDYCDRSYTDKRNLIVHLRIHDDSVASNLIRFECKACGADFCENRILINHIRRVHFNHVDANEPLHINRMINESWFEKVVQTDTCVKMTKVNNNVISIKKCGKIKSESTSLSSQQMDIKENYFLQPDNYTSYSKAICDYCNKEMLKKSIRNHIRERHLNVRNFKCSECKRTFNRHYQLVYHKCGVTGRKRQSNVSVTSKSHK